MITGHLMNTKTCGNDVFQGMGRVVGGASLLLLISAGLELFAQHPDKGNSIAGVLLAIFLAFWLYVLGLGVLLFLSFWWLVEWRRVRMTGAAMSGFTPAEPRGRSFEESNDKNETNSLTRVA